MNLDWSSFDPPSGGDFLTAPAWPTPFGSLSVTLTKTTIAVP